jgi:hypothetical protein
MPRGDTYFFAKQYVSHATSNVDYPEQFYRLARITNGTCNWGWSSDGEGVRLVKNA